ncbi:hypothetical protein [Nocardia sp. NPDC004604]|uniref:hypothetical protein n=1 Tax=Nocardia sp. NPDC004604 TaxID=3157013 RepID=UPI0033A29057
MEQQSPEGNWFFVKLSDLGALIGLGLAFVVSIGLSGLASSTLSARVLINLHLSELPGARLVLVSVLLGFLASRAVFTSMIARLPRELDSRNRTCPVRVARRRRQRGLGRLTPYETLNQAALAA